MSAVSSARSSRPRSSRPPRNRSAPLLFSARTIRPTCPGRSRSWLCWRPLGSCGGARADWPWPRSFSASRSSRSRRRCIRSITRSVTTPSRARPRPSRRTWTARRSPRSRSTSPSIGSAPSPHRPNRASTPSARSIRRSPARPRSLSSRSRSSNSQTFKGDPMRGKALFACALALALSLTSVHVAQAHGLIGKRFFPATLATDDPFVADELSLPTISHIKTPGDTPTRETDISAEISKRLTPDLGVSLAGTYKILDADASPLLNGFDNMEVTLKYVFFKNAEHETLLSAGLSWDVGGTGSKKVGAESFDTITPTLFWGKGFGDLPEALQFVRPLA